MWYKACTLFWLWTIISDYLLFTKCKCKYIISIQIDSLFIIFCNSHSHTLLHPFVKLYIISSRLLSVSMHHFSLFDKTLCFALKLWQVLVRVAMFDIIYIFLKFLCCPLSLILHEVSSTWSWWRHHYIQTCFYFQFIFSMKELNYF